MTREHEVPETQTSQIRALDGIDPTLDVGNHVDVDRLAFKPSGMVAGPSVPRDHEGSRREAVTAALLLARIEIDEALQQLPSTPPASRARVAIDHINRALIQMEEIDILTDYQNVDLSSTQDEFRAFSFSFQRLVTSDFSGTDPKLMRDLTENRGWVDTITRKISKRMGSGASPEVAGPSQSKKMVEQQVITTTIDMIGTEAYQLYEALHEKDRDRDDTVEMGSSLILKHISHLDDMAGDSIKSYQSQLDKASMDALLVQKWIKIHHTNAKMTAHYQPVLSAMDRIRDKAGLVSIMMITGSPSVSEKAFEEGEDEGREVRMAIQRLDKVKDNTLTGIHSGVERFTRFSALPSPTTPDSVWAQMAKSVGIVALGNAAGPLVSWVLGRSSPKIKGHQDAGKGWQSKGLQMLEGQVIDTVQALVPKIGESAIDPASKNKRIRDIQYFAESFKLFQTNAAGAIYLEVKKSVELGMIAPSEVDALAENAVTTLQLQLEETYRACSHGYALLSAHQNLRSSDQQPGSTSNREDYYGRYKDEYRNGIGKQGRSGVCQLHVQIEHDPAAKASLKYMSFSVYGMNPDLGSAILQRADYVLNRIELPMEVHVHGNDTMAQFAVDELGSLRGEQNWGALVLAMVKKTRNGASPRTAFYGTALNMWRAMRETRMPPEVRVDGVKE